MFKFMVGFMVGASLVGLFLITIEMSCVAHRMASLLSKIELALTGKKGG